MSIIFKPPYDTWIKKNVGENIDENTLFRLRVAAKTQAGLVDVDVDLDLIWFILINVDNSDPIKLSILQVLLQQPVLLQKFKVTLDSPKIKRVIAEFLLFNYEYLKLLRPHIDFTKLNDPVDFISHSLLIKRGEQNDTKEQMLEKVKIIDLVLATGFKLPADNTNDGAALKKLLLLEEIADRFVIAKKLLAIGFKLFSPYIKNNYEIAIFLINNRSNPDCLEIINNHIEELKKVQLHVPGSGDECNLADYYYWVKEDLPTVRFIKDTLGLSLTPSN